VVLFVAQEECVDSSQESSEGDVLRMDQTTLLRTEV
jgi:hypothetical protein